MINMQIQIQHAYDPVSIHQKYCLDSLLSCIDGSNVLEIPTIHIISIVCEGTIFL